MVNEKVLAFANKISGLKINAKGVTPDRPEYKILEPVITGELAEIGVHLEFRNRKSAKEIAKEVGKPVEEVAKALEELAWHGAAFMGETDGVDKYWLELWAPGHMEMMVNNKENVKKYPQIGLAFEEFSRLKGGKAAGLFPVGTGPMRIIPIETAIEGNTHHASYEEVSKYLNESSRFSVSDCSCRTSREAAGEGCGHLKEDMCIQLDHAAEYYIRTGRAREITREEAFEIIKRAEENGLMHSIPNVDGKGKTHAICNCCGCSCFALRNATMFHNQDFMRSNYVSHVDPEKCVACGECVEVCPTNAAKLGQKLCSKEPIKIEMMEDTPCNTKWSKDKWNVDYRTNRKNVVDSGTSPCKTNCPAHISVQGYIKLAAQGRYTEALELIKHENPFPAVCGRVCPKLCEDACTRGDLDDPVSVDEIKKFIAEKDLHAEHRFVPKKRHDYGNKIAIIGAGPSGLSCAYYLAIDGYEVTVFEKQEVLGGMLTLGIPSYRLEKDVIGAEIEVLKELGVQFKTGVEVGKDVTLKALREEGFEAFYLAIGAQKGRRLGIEGEEAQGVLTGVKFLRDVNLGKEMDMKGKVVVIGGGNVAIDVARTATRLEAEEVALYCLESKDEMPALDEEIREAESEAICMENSWGPTKILVEDGKVVGVQFKKCLSVFDEGGRFAPKFDEESIKEVKADHVLISVGQAMEWGNLLEESQVKLRPNKTVEVDTFTLQTAEADIFAGGDAATGPAYAIDAIALGKEAAISIHRFVQPGQSLVIGRDRREYKSFDKEGLILAGYDQTPRQRVAHVSGDKAKTSFKDLRGTLNDDQVKKETERCLSCGATFVDEYLCVGCGACTTRCKFDAISLVRKYDAEGVEFEDLKPTVVKNMVKRQGRILAHKVKKAFRHK